MLHAAPCHLGSAAAGAAGALGASLAVRLADRKGVESVIRVGAALVAGPLRLIAVGAMVFDLGMQAALVGHQTIVYSIDPAARSRLNADLFTAMFTGMASGAWLGGLAAVSALAALAVRLWPVSRATATTA